MNAPSFRVCECATRGLTPTPDKFRDDQLTICRRCGDPIANAGLAQVQAFCSDLADRLAVLEASGDQADPDEQLTVQQAARLAKVSVRTIERNRDAWGFPPAAESKSPRTTRRAVIVAMRRREGKP